MVLVIIQAKAFSFFLYAAHIFWLLFCQKALHYFENQTDSRNPKESHTVFTVLKLCWVLPEILKQIYH